MTGTITEFGRRNDAIRRQGLFGPGEASDLRITPSVADLGDAALETLVLAFMRFDGFEPDDDPYGNRDFGVLDAAGTMVWFKIDPKEGNDDARVITFHLPDEH